MRPSLRLGLASLALLATIATTAQAGNMRTEGIFSRNLGSPHDMDATIAYTQAMNTAVQMPATTAEQATSRNAAIATARRQLAAASFFPLSGSGIAEFDRQLGLPPTDPWLGLR